MKNQKKSYDNKGKKYLEDEKAIIFRLFQEGFSRKEIANMMNRTIRSISEVIDSQIRSSIIFSDEEFRKIRMHLTIYNNFTKHTLAKDVINKHKDIIQWSLMEGGEYEADEILEFLSVESNIFRYDIELQKYVRNNPNSTEKEAAQELIDSCGENNVKPLSYYLHTIKGLKECVKKFKRYRNNILNS